MDNPYQSPEVCSVPAADKQPPAAAKHDIFSVSILIGFLFGTFLWITDWVGVTERILISVTVGVLIAIALWVTGFPHRKRITEDIH